MKILPKIGILILVILGAAGSCFSAFGSSKASVTTVPFPEPVLLILLGTGLITLAGFGKKWKRTPQLNSGHHLNPGRSASASRADIEKNKNRIL